MGGKNLMLQGNGQFWGMSQESLMKVEKYHRNKNTVLAVENEIQFLQVNQDTAI